MSAPVQSDNLAEETAIEPTLVLTVAYNGGDFSGFAAQSRPEVRTVADEINGALSTLLRREVQVVCAGRTDAGVHAREQVVSLQLAAGEEDLLRNRNIKRSLAALLPNDIAVSEVYFAPPGFSARFDAIKREYVYRIFIGEGRPLFTNDFAWWVRKPLNILDMKEAAQVFVGEHDFASFCVARSAQGKNTVRTIESISITTEKHFEEELLCIYVVGTAFLHTMIRIIVGSLVEVGLGNREPAWIQSALAARDRQSAGPTAPAQGLTFWHVEYDKSEWKKPSLHNSFRAEYD